MFEVRCSHGTTQNCIFAQHPDRAAAERLRQLALKTKHTDARIVKREETKP